MKKLVVYYSRTNTTKKIAVEIGKRLDADVEEIIDKKDRRGVMGYISGGKDAFQRKLTDIDERHINPGNYDMVIIGTPVWAGTMTPAIRTYVERNKGKFFRVAYFCTQGGSNRQKVFDDLKELADRSPAAELMLRTKEVASGDYSKKLDEFIEKLKK